MGEKLVTVARFSTAFEAHVAKGRLESSGIRAVIFDENVVNINWLYSNAVGGVKLKVREEDAAEAREILKAEPAEVSDEEAGADVAGVCPRCGGTRIEYAVDKRGPIWTWIIFGVPLLPVKKRLRCRNCGHEWKPDRTK